MECVLCGKPFSKSSVILDAIPYKHFRVITRQHTCNTQQMLRVEVKGDNGRSKFLPRLYRDYPVLHVLSDSEILVCVDNENFLVSGHTMRMVYPGFSVHKASVISNHIVLFGIREDEQCSRLAAFNRSKLSTPIFDNKFDGAYHVRPMIGNMARYVTFDYTVNGKPATVGDSNIIHTKRVVEFDLVAMIENSLTSW